MTAAAQTTRLPDSRHPATIAVLLDWLHDTLPAPKPPRWQTERQSGFASTRRSSDWHDCDGGCGGKGKTRWGRCHKCGGTGGWYTDPMDRKARDLRLDADAHPSTPDHRTVKLSADTDAELAKRDGLPPALEQIAAALADLRTANRYHRSILQRVHVIRLNPPHTLRPAEHALYLQALDHLAVLLPAAFRAPKWCREKAAGTQTGRPEDRPAPPRRAA